MTPLRTWILVAAAATALPLATVAQTPGGPAPSRPASAAAPPAHAMGMARMDEHMKSMRAMHDKMMAAKTPEARQALMAEQMKLMQDGMAMMGGMPGMGPMGGDMAARQQMMEKRMEVMQSMMQMMVDRMQSAPPGLK